MAEQEIQKRYQFPRAGRCCKSLCERAKTKIFQLEFDFLGKMFGDISSKTISMDDAYICRKAGQYILLRVPHSTCENS